MSMPSRSVLLLQVDNESLACKNFSGTLLTGTSVSSGYGTGGKMIKTGSVYSPMGIEAGLKVLVTRYWPRGVSKGRVDLWLRGLGPAPELIKEWKAGSIDWDEFKRRYAAEFKEPEKKRLFEELLETVRSAKTGVTLLCACRADEPMCHRAILSSMLLACS